MMDVKNDQETVLTAFRTLESAGQFPGKVRVIYVPWINDDVFAFSDPQSKLIFVAVNKWIRVDQWPRGITIQSDELLEEAATGATWKMDRVVAHEIGHVLGLSKRTDFETPQLPGDTNGERNGTERIGHDGGKFPERTVGLMRSGFVGAPGKWLRHEDWEAANLGAAEVLRR